MNQPTRQNFKSFRDLPDLPRALANQTCKGNTDAVCQRMKLGQQPKKKWGYDRTHKLTKQGEIACASVIVVNVHVRNRNLRYSYLE